jgi:hypothetical protein
MRYYSFENLEMNSDGHYDLFQKTMVNKPTLAYDTIVVTEQFQGRLDSICRYVHGNTQYLEEIMTLNNIINPNSVKLNDIIKYYSNTTNYSLLYESDLDTMDKKDEILLMNKNKSTKSDKNRIGSPPTIRPDNLKQIDVNHSKKKITIINKFK